MAWNLSDGELLCLCHPVLLWYDDVRHVLCVGVELLRQGEAPVEDGLVVQQVVLDAVVDVGDLGDVE